MNNVAVGRPTATLELRIEEPPPDVLIPRLRALLAAEQARVRELEEQIEQLKKGQ